MLREQPGRTFDANEYYQMTPEDIADLLRAEDEVAVDPIGRPSVRRNGAAAAVAAANHARCTQREQQAVIFALASQRAFATGRDVRQFCDAAAYVSDNRPFSVLITRLHKLTAADVSVMISGFCNLKPEAGADPRPDAPAHHSPLGRLIREHLGAPAARARQRRPHRHHQSQAPAVRGGHSQQPERAVWAGAARRGGGIGHRHRHVLHPHRDPERQDADAGAGGRQGAAADQGKGGAGAVHKAARLPLLGTSAWTSKADATPCGVSEPGSRAAAAMPHYPGVVRCVRAAAALAMTKLGASRKKEPLVGVVANDVLSAALHPAAAALHPTAAAGQRSSQCCFTTVLCSGAVVLRWSGLGEGAHHLPLGQCVCGDMGEWRAEQYE